ncbi:hypothetical protein ACPDXS_003540 [Vibrio cholerae]|uniref:hypothetical protein n=1 Tax=Vibrio cholerae TaxID=666 RepID=UPI00089376A3|nr:hypothetical protein [Vibrio cholerae]EHV2410704.1 hypothetical protein [Vibrio cholerae]EJL6311371.1 hypothetical protein [Vibrio cholerae]EKF9118062.1 hypothetical protein [Vibrio cholerae]EKF9288446.1 hypothetical protein [Vibrio cholerae]EKF9843154.1 hypothetical protein [Vibrio cholerae]
MEKCKLCLKEKKLRNSHIIPDAFFQFIKKGNRNGRHIVISDEGNSWQQETCSEKMLCGECEHKFSSKFEKYAAELLLYNPSKIGATVKQFNGHVELSGIDYAKLKLFQMSLLWRASVSEQKFYKNVSLSSFDEELLRSRLNELNPLLEHQFPCTFERVMNDVLPSSSDRKNRKSGLASPKTTDIGYCKYITFVLGGFSIRTYLHCNYPLPTKRLLKQTGSLECHDIKIEHHEILSLVIKKQAENINSNKCKVTSV